MINFAARNFLKKKKKMVIINDLLELTCKKLVTEACKARIRMDYPYAIAQTKCNAIDRVEKIEHFQRLLKEYNEWMQYQQRQQEAVQRFLSEYYK